MEQKVIITTDIRQSLADAVAQVQHDRLFVLTDATTHRLCLPIVADLPCLRDARHIVIGCGDAEKTLQTLSDVWAQLSDGGGTRHSLMVNIGGGMLTDLGGFAASTFKRGIPYINLPTTLLAMVDASVGGKTGINFNGLKNEIGVFSTAESVLLDTAFLRTLDRQNLLSGYAEMLKHGLISNDTTHLNELLTLEPCVTDNTDFCIALSPLVATSVGVKQRIVEQDPHEHGLRKALNLGHTIGHAIESLALQSGRPMLHGYAVAFGLVCELYLSCVKCGFPTSTMRQTVRYVREHYGAPTFTCDDYPALFDLMTHDKKNTAGSINFTLLANVGELRLNQTATRDEIYESLDFLREG
ncbi:MAG: 3-dehydroquinate synthase [Prevotellaceae bacterium]|nr:3-dehydroquinate synthase [Prevotellaceae bacterium]